jgi:CelD/BcsL family acetyltransferase involved in cellulose biosynthesis
MRAELLDPRTDARWQEFVGRAPRATMFHHPLWLRLLSDEYGYPFEACCLVDDRGRVVAGLPWARIASRLTGRRLVALPFSDACGPLSDGGSEAELAAAVDAARGEAGLGLEVRARVEGLPGESPQRYWQHTLALEPDAEAVARGASSGVRRGVAKARREGLTVERRTDPAALDDFYRLHLRTRRRLGVPTQSKRFIAGLAALFGPGHGFVALVHAEGARPVAAAVFLRLRDHLIYKYGASDEAALPLRPNNALFAEVIRWGCENGCRELDFGRSDMGDEGLRRFKRGWGAEELPLHYTYAGLPVPGEGVSPAQRALGHVIRHSPPVLGRLTGSALYRHFG